MEEQPRKVKVKNGEIAPKVALTPNPSPGGRGWPEAG
jgi:hypothetical protein